MMKLFENEAFKFVFVLGVCIVISFIFVGLFVAGLSDLESSFSNSNQGEGSQAQNKNLL